MARPAKARNVTHQQKKLNEEELVEFAGGFDIPISDAAARRAEFYRPPEDSPGDAISPGAPECVGGFCTEPALAHCELKPPKWEDYAEFFAGSEGREVSTTMASCGCCRTMRDKNLAATLCRFVPDESSHLRNGGLFRQFGIYSHTGRSMKPVVSDTSSTTAKHRRQILEEGNEAGSMSSFIAAGSSRSSHGLSMIPSSSTTPCSASSGSATCFGLRVICACRGFVLGGTAGRTTLAGEGLQHQDGNSQLNALAFPNCRAYDPSYAYMKWP